MLFQNWHLILQCPYFKSLANGSCKPALFHRLETAYQAGIEFREVIDFPLIIDLLKNKKGYKKDLNADKFRNSLKYLFFTGIDSKRGDELIKTSLKEVRDLNYIDDIFFDDYRF